MSAAAANLVDSNVFIRSLPLSGTNFGGERLDALFRPTLQMQPTPMEKPDGTLSRSYLTHLWWDVVPISLSVP
jgi:hypothetical protein